MTDEELKIGDFVQLLNEETGDPYKKGIVDKYDPIRGRVGVKTETGSYACWNIKHIVKINNMEQLKKAAKEHSKTVFHKPFSENPQEEHIVYDPDKYDAFIAGAEWMKKQMMKEAVEGTVYGNGDYTWVAGDIPSQFKYGDKVKLIICKEDEK